MTKIRMKKYDTDIIILNSYQEMALSKIQLFIIFGLCIQTTIAVCPNLCDCKWKNGKESVICLNANLSVVPLHLEAGTQVIDLTGNQLVTVKHDEFSRAGLVNLQKIHIAKCRLKNLERFAFRNLINLVELDLSYNVLSSIPSHAFDSIPELRELKLNGNPIQRISNDAFLTVPQLVRLELTECRIGTIESRAFNGLEKSLEWLKLDKNRLIEVKSKSFTLLQSLHGLELAGNPWNCSCILRPLREWMLRNNVPFGVPPVCQYPKRLFSKPWDKLELDEFACVPEIFAYDSKAHGIEGKNVTMTCRIQGIPEPNVRWILKNKVIANLSGASYSNGKKLYLVHLQNNSSDLTIFSADLQDAGVYVCAAENKAGKVEASVTLAVSKKPPEANVNSKALIASVITGITFVILSCLIALCVCSVRKKQILRWRTRECRREDNYEKIEMNHKVTGNFNGGVIQQNEIPTVANRRNGEYRVVPGGDTDQDAEDDEDNVDVNAPKTNKTWSNDPLEKRWNSPEHLLDPEDLHIPRRTLQETRDDLKKNTNSKSGIYSKYQLQQQPGTSTSISTVSSQQFPTHLLRRQPLGRSESGTIYTTTFNKELSSLAEDEIDKKYPDLIENSSYRFNTSIGKASSEGGSVSDITDLFCTLPRKRGLIQNSRYRSTDSQSPLLPESRYGSSGGESSTSQDSTFKRMSDAQKYPATNLNRTRGNKISNSYLNLTRDREENVNIPSISGQSLNTSSTATATPLLDVSSLENRVFYKKETISPSSGTPNANSYDYHAAQLERFLEEYRTLQKQLTKMKETCNNLRQDKRQFVQDNSTSTIAGCSEDAAGKLVLKNNPLATSPNSNQPLEHSIDFRNFESELTKYLLAKGSSYNNSVFNN